MSGGEESEKHDSSKKNRSRRGGKGRQINSKPLTEQNINLPKEGITCINAN